MCHKYIYTSKHMIYIYTLKDVYIFFNGLKYQLMCAGNSKTAKISIDYHRYSPENKKCCNKSYKRQHWPMSSERDSFAKGIFSTFAKGFLLHKLLLKVNFSPLRVKKSRSHDMGHWQHHIVFTRCILLPCCRFTLLSRFGCGCGCLLPINKKQP
jgi:hypothetical protein